MKYLLYVSKDPYLNRGQMTRKFWPQAKTLGLFPIKVEPHLIDVDLGNFCTSNMASLITSQKEYKEYKEAI